MLYELMAEKILLHNSWRLLWDDPTLRVEAKGTLSFPFDENCRMFEGRSQAVDSRNLLSLLSLPERVLTRTPCA